MWLVNPRMMCRQHLLGEHLECHMFVGAIRTGRSLAGYIEKGLLDGERLKERHANLATEMYRRGYKHNSPLPYFVPAPDLNGRIDVRESEAELRRRCPNCNAIAVALEALRKEV